MGRRKSGGMGRRKSGGDSAIISEKQPLPCPDIILTPHPQTLTKPFLTKLYLHLLHLLSSHDQPNPSSHLSTHLFSHLSHRPDQLELLLLLRCCLLFLPLLEPFPTLLLHNSRRILPILRHSLSQSCSLLEVFLDELLLRRQLTSYLMLVDDDNDGDQLFRPSSDHDGSGVVIELLSAHFIVAARTPNPGIQHLSLTSAMQLLGTPPLVDSAPQLFQAHVISMVAKSVSAHRDWDLDDGGVGKISISIAYCISAFQKSLLLYATQLKCLCSDEPASISGTENWPHFQSYIRPDTYNAINQVADIPGSIPSFSFKTKSEFLTACDAYITDNMKRLNRSFRIEIRSVLNSLVSQILESKVEGIMFCTTRDASPQQIYLIASMVNLMSSSLMQTVHCMVRGSLGQQKQEPTDCHSFRKGYDFIVDIIGCFLESTVGGSAQKLLKKVVGFNSTKLILIHFASFLPFCYARGYDYLRKCCLLAMMAIMNLIVFEDGDLEALKTLLSSMEKLLSANSATKSSQVSRSSIIAAKIQKLRSRSTSKKATCNGEKFLKALNMKQSDISDLADYVECEKGKDYTKYVKIREKYRTWLDTKRQIRKQERRIKIPKAFTGIQSGNL